MCILQMANLNENIKNIALKAFEESKPVNICYGIVKTINPLSIFVEQKMLLPAEFFVLSRNVTNYSATMTINWSTENAQGHNHSVSGDKTVTINNALKVGEKVILIRFQGGQDYLVLDRIG